MTKELSRDYRSGWSDCRQVIIAMLEPPLQGAMLPAHAEVLESVVETIRKLQTPSHSR